MSLILVTGANGLLGQALQAALKTDGLSYLFLGRDQLDISDYKQVAIWMANAKPNLVINCAAMTDVDGAENDPLTAFQMNSHAPALLAHACRVHRAHLIQLSTDFVFDGESAPYNETDTATPLSVYGRSKLAGENVVLRITANATVIRTAWLFDRYKTNFLTTLCARIQSQSTVEVVDNQIGSPTYAGDLAHLLDKLSSKIINNKQCSNLTNSRIFHFGGTPFVSRYEWALTIRKYLGEYRPTALLADIKPVKQWPSVAVRPHSSSLHSDKIFHLIKITPSDWQAASRLLIEREIHHENHQPIT